MAPKSVIELVEFLSAFSLPVRVGIWFYPLSYLGCEEDEAVRLGVKAIDVRQKYIEAMPEGAAFVNLSAAKMFALVHQLVEQPSDYETLLIYNLDLLLARLSLSDRQEFWSDMLTAMRHRKHGALIAFPETAAETAPHPDQLQHWLHEGRVVGAVLIHH